MTCCDTIDQLMDRGHVAHAQPYHLSNGTIITEIDTEYFLVFGERAPPVRGRQLLPVLRPRAFARVVEPGEEEMKRALVCALLLASAAMAKEHRYLYVAEPGIRDYLEYGGHGLLVFDIDDGHKFVKRIPTRARAGDGQAADNVKGIAADAKTGRIYVSTIKTLMCLDLVTEKILWEQGVRGRLRPDVDLARRHDPLRAVVRRDHWNVVNALNGDVIAKIIPNSGAHNTVYGLDGTHVYLAGLKSPLLTVADTDDPHGRETVGPFAAAIRPFTVNGGRRSASSTSTACSASRSAT